MNMFEEKIKVKLADQVFGPDGNSSHQLPKYIKWDRSEININDKVVIITECNLNDRYKVVNKETITFAWFLESPEVLHPNGYNWFKNINNQFTYVLTNIKDLLDLGENYIFCPTGGCWILPDDQKIHQKSKLVSIIASWKNWTSGHKIRHEIISIYKNKFDLYGDGYNKIENKIVGLKDYAFSLIIENTKQDYYFSEKLVDCFITGTVPIYWGCPSIGNFFNIDGMIIFDKVEDLKTILDELSIEKYNEMKYAIDDNFEKVKSYLSTEDYIYTNYLNKLIDIEKFKPSKKVNTGSYSQSGQDVFVLSLFDKDYKGVFVDIGCGHPKNINNTLLLEEYDWNGISIDIDESLTKLWESRKTPFIQIDALDCDYIQLFRYYNISKIIDYLTLDISGGFRYLALKKIIDSGFEFKVITIQHDVYAGYDLSDRQPQRKLLKDNGYFLLCSDNNCNGVPIEDWWINPKYLDEINYMHYLSSDIDYLEVLKKINKK